MAGGFELYRYLDGAGRVLGCRVETPSRVVIWTGRREVVITTLEAAGSMKASVPKVNFGRVGEVTCVDDTGWERVGSGNPYRQVRFLTINTTGADVQIVLTHEVPDSSYETEVDLRIVGMNVLTYRRLGPIPPPPATKVYDPPYDNSQLRRNGPPKKRKPWRPPHLDSAWSPK